MKFLSALLLAAAAGLVPWSARAADRRPNILVILADDIGFSDIGCYGGEIRTPALDSLAAGGVRFTQFYNTARCCPTRASLLTGLHPHQAGIGHMMEDRGQPGYRGNLNRDCVTIAEALKPAGYRCYAAGKWHVTPGASVREGGDRSNWPLQRGFDRYYGTIHGAGSFFDPSSLVRDNQSVTVANDPGYHPADGYYYTDAIADHAVKFIREHGQAHGDQPFFLYTAFTAAHWPLQARERDIAKYKGLYDKGYEPVRAARREKMVRLGLISGKEEPSAPAEQWEEVKDKAWESRCMEVYAAQIDSMDQGIARITAELKARGELENTLIFYLQDNGACAENIGRGPTGEARPARPTLPPLDRDTPQQGSRPRQTRDGWPVREGTGVMPGGADTYISYGRGWANVSNTPFREYKHWTHEGGISTPLIVHWPAGIPADRAGSLEPQPGQLPDLMASCLDAAGAVYPAEFAGRKIRRLEGVSLRPALAGEAVKRPQPLVWEHEGNRAIREGNWKLVAKEDEPWELYNLAGDRTEQHDLAAAEPGRVRQMSAAWDAWAARANVLPLGAWKNQERADRARAGGKSRFTLKQGGSLEGAAAPGVAGRPLTLTVRFVLPAAADAPGGGKEAGPGPAPSGSGDSGPPSPRDPYSGVLAAQGGAAHGYALYLDRGRLHFTVRSQGGASTLSTACPPGPGMRTAKASLTADGSLSLQLDSQPAATAPGKGLIARQPKDGLNAGSDEGGAVGPYETPCPFQGRLESVTLELGKSGK